MINIAGADEETISFSKAVKATGNIEDWLGALEKGMQVCMYVCRRNGLEPVRTEKEAPIDGKPLLPFSRRATTCEHTIQHPAVAQML